jgi:hypothetical protein
MYKLISGENSNKARKDRQSLEQILAEADTFGLKEMAKVASPLTQLGGVDTTDSTSKKCTFPLSANSVYLKVPNKAGLQFRFHSGAKSPDRKSEVHLEFKFERRGETTIVNLLNGVQSEEFGVKMEVAVNPEANVGTLTVTPLKEYIPPNVAEALS